MSRLVGMGLLSSAFAPLVALLALLQHDKLGCLTWVVLSVCAAAALLLALVLHSLAAIQRRPVETASVRRADERVLGFTSSYVVPVVVALFNGTNVLTVAATLALSALLALIYVRGGLYHLNPVLAVAGFRLFEVTETNGTVTMLLSRKTHIGQHGVLQCRYLTEDVAIDLKERNDRRSSP